MISGRQTLVSIDSGLHELRGKISKGEQQIEKRGRQLLSLQQQEIQSYKELSRLRVKVLSADPRITFPDDAERTVQGLLEQRLSGLQKIRDEIAASQQQRSDLEQKRQAQALVVEEAAKTEDAVEKRTQDRLDDDPAYKEQLLITKEMERTVKHAQDKATQREEELENKGTPYHSDPLFMYLWNRKYSTVEYQANPLTRWLDGKVARLIHYGVARVNFSKLQEIPRRLREHAGQVEQKAKQEFEVLKALDTKAREQDGIPALEKILKQKEAELKAIDEQLEKVVARQREQEQLQTDYSVGEDQYYKQAIDYLATELRRDDIKDLRRQAQATPYPEDDLIISKLLDLEGQENDVQDGITELKTFNAQQQQRLHDLESMRSEFKGHRYDSAGIGFSDPAVIYATLGNLINGVLTRDAFWRVLEQQRRYQPRRANPSFGSGGFGRGTVWGGGMHFPGSGGGSIFGSGRRGGFSFPGGGSRGRSGGGFSTGGGF